MDNPRGAGGARVVTRGSGARGLDKSYHGTLPEVLDDFADDCGAATAAAHVPRVFDGYCTELSKVGLVVQDSKTRYVRHPGDSESELRTVREKLAPGGFRTPGDDPVQDGAVYLGAPISHYPEWMTGALGRRREAHATLLERIAFFGTSGYGCHHGAMRLLVVCAVRQTGFFSRMMPPPELDPFLAAGDAANISAAFSLLGLDACDQSTPRMEAAIVQMSMPADFGGLNLALLQSEAPAAFYSAQSVVLPKLVREYGPALGPLYEAVRAEVSSVATSALPWARETRRVRYGHRRACVAAGGRRTRDEGVIRKGDPGDFYMKVIAKKFRGVWHYGVITGVVTEWVLEDYGGATQWRAVFEDGSGKVTVQSGWVMEDCLHHMETFSILSRAAPRRGGRGSAAPRRGGRGSAAPRQRRPGQRGAKARRPGQRGAKARRPGQRGAKTAAAGAARRQGAAAGAARRQGAAAGAARRQGAAAGAARRQGAAAGAARRQGAAAGAARRQGAAAGAARRQDSGGRGSAAPRQRRPGQRGAKARRPGQRGAKARRPGQRGAKARRPGQRGAKARRPGQRGAKARRPGQRGAKTAAAGAARRQDSAYSGIGGKGCITSCGRQPLKTMRSCRNNPSTGFWIPLIWLTAAGCGMQGRMTEVAVLVSPQSLHAAEAAQPHRH
eukprot:jgi/Tetstr1/441338/TSEL_029589.t1